MHLVYNFEILVPGLLYLSQIFNVTTKEWTEVASMQNDRLGSMGSSFVLDGEFWTFGSIYYNFGERVFFSFTADAEVYNVASNTWRTVNDVWLDPEPEDSDRETHLVSAGVALL